MLGSVCNWFGVVLKYMFKLLVTKQQTSKRVFCTLSRSLSLLFYTRFIWQFLTVVFFFSKNFFNPPGLPSSPQNLGYHVQHYGPHNVTVTVQWEYPEFDGGVPLDNYTISGTNIMTTTSQINATLTLPYNARQTIEVTAANCIGTSRMAMLIYFEGEASFESRLWLHLYLLPQSTKHCCRLDNSHSQFQYDHCQEIVYNPVFIATV